MPKDKTLRVTSITYRNGKSYECEIAEGENDEGDGPARTVARFFDETDAREVCQLHNAIENTKRDE